MIGAGVTMTVTFGAGNSSLLTGHVKSNAELLGLRLPIRSIRNQSLSTISQKNAALPIMIDGIMATYSPRESLVRMPLEWQYHPLQILAEHDMGIRF